jgi:hypothetical protein
MTKSFAIVTDIHGNHTALEAVLEDIRAFQKSSACGDPEILCLGDSYDGGPEPLRVFHALRALNCVHLRGNHEDYLFDCLRHPLNEKYQRPLWKFVPWTVDRLGTALVEAERLCAERWSDSVANLHAVHASRTGNSRVPDFFVSQSALSDSFVEQHTLLESAAVYVNGHSHYLGLHRNPSANEVWINCGSVGYPFVEKPRDAGHAPVACWVWIEVEDSPRPERRIRVINRRVPYSGDTLLRQYVDSGALEQCAPFSFAVAAQSLFNQDVVYPFFQRIKGLNLTPRETARLLVEELERQSVPERINAMIRQLGLKSLPLRV